MAFKFLIYNIDKNVATITINKPDRMNALDLNVVQEIIDAIDLSCMDKEVRVMILTGSGNKAFSAGADLEDKSTFEETSQIRIRENIMQYQQLPMAIRNASKPIIASVNGVAAGGSCNLVLSCDMIVASDTARFVQGFANIGLSCDTGGTYFLPRIIGYSKACEFLMTRQILNAAEAMEMGLINKVVSADKLEAETKKLASKIADGPPVAIRLLKNTLNRSMELNLTDTLEIEGSAHAACFTTRDFKEGVGAFLEKRKPKFVGE